MKLTREPATLEPAVKIGHQYVPVADGITLSELDTLTDYSRVDPLGDVLLVEIIADYTKRQEIEQERRQVREEVKGGLEVRRQ